jgi:ABC-type sugar transport system ATPase subunit
MEISISNCNNIDQGSLSLVENALNIKYAINGTGKSTISKAITSYISDKMGNAFEILKDGNRVLIISPGLFIENNIRYNL